MRKQTAAAVFAKLLVALLAVVVIGVWIFCATQSRETICTRSCQSSMKEMALAFNLYCNDHDGMLPSSALCGSSDWTFRTTLGTMPPRRSSRPATIFALLYPYRRNRQIYFCPNDRRKWSGDYTDIPPPSTPTSYVLKKAVNQAWIDPKVKARNIDDFRWPDEQVLFYERTECKREKKGWFSRTLPEGKGDLSDPANKKKLNAHTNMVFMDTHVNRHRITEFEPDYYNADGNTMARAKRPQINPRVYRDALP